QLPALAASHQRTRSMCTALTVPTITVTATTTRATIMIEILLPALLIGLLLAAIAGPLGCFVVWGRLAYFGDTLAHSALLGIALGFLFQLNLTVGVILVTSALAL